MPGLGWAGTGSTDDRWPGHPANHTLMFLSTTWMVRTGSQVYTDATHIKCTLYLQLIVCQLHVNKAITNTSLETVAPWLGAHGK